MSERWGAKLGRRSMCDWVEVASLCLEPVHRKMHRALLNNGYLRTDKTPIRCSDPDEKRGDNPTLPPGD